MTVTVILSTVPGTRTRDNYGTSSTISVIGDSLDRETLPGTRTVAEIRAAVARFGAKVRAEYPDASFYVSVRLARGDCKPNGYDAASRRNGLEQENFMRLVDRRTAPAAPHGTLSAEAEA